MPSMLFKNFSFQVMCKMVLAAYLVLGSFGSANAANERNGLPRLELGCAISDMVCQWHQINIRLSEFNHSVSTYNRRTHNQDDTVACNSNTILTLASASEEGQEQTAIQNQCQQGEVPAQSALWVLALSLVGFVITSTKRNV